MPNVMDRAQQLLNELKTTRFFGGEIDKMDATTRKAAQADLLPELEKCVDLGALQQYNEKVRLWIDQHPRP